MVKDRLLELLLGMGLISEDLVQRAVNEQKRHGGEMGRILLDLGMITEETLVRAYSTLYSIPAVTLAPSSLSPATAKQLPKAICEKHNVVAFRVDSQKRTLDVAMADPTDLDLSDEVRRASRLSVRFFLASRTAIAAAITYCFYGDNLANLGSEVNMYEATSYAEKSIQMSTTPISEHGFGVREPRQPAGGMPGDPGEPHGAMDGAAGYGAFTPGAGGAPAGEDELVSVHLSRTGAVEEGSGPREILIDLEEQAAAPRRPSGAAAAAPARSAPAPGVTRRDLQELGESLSRLEEVVAMNRTVLERLLRLLMQKRIISREEAMKVVEP